jgi:hypothetical protein
MPVKFCPLALAPETVTLRLAGAKVKPAFVEVTVYVSSGTLLKVY